MLALEVCQQADHAGALVLSLMPRGIRQCLAAAACSAPRGSLSPRIDALNMHGMNLNALSTLSLSLSLFPCLSYPSSAFRRSGTSFQAAYDQDLTRAPMTHGSSSVQSRVSNGRCYKSVEKVFESYVIRLKWVFELLHDVFFFSKELG